jgi:hypothetical protein
MKIITPGHAPLISNLPNPSKGVPGGFNPLPVWSRIIAGAEGAIIARASVLTSPLAERGLANHTHATLAVCHV